MKRFHNRTRTAQSIPRKLLFEGKWFLVPVYYLLLTSHLAREGIMHSGSYRFADHIYGGKPKGKYVIGHALDALLLNLPSAQAFRYRYHRVKEELAQSVVSNSSGAKILYVPSGLAREFFEIDASIDLHTDTPEQIRLCGIDLDDALVEMLMVRAKSARTPMEFRVGDALSADVYEEDHDLVVSTGLLDFLPETEARSFFKLVYNALKPGGRFVTSGMQPHRLSEFLMRQFGELNTVYRTKEELEALAVHAGFSEVRTTQDRHKLQAVIVATK